MLRYFFFFLIISFSSFSQEPMYVQYTTKDGLPSSQVYDVVQDKYGHLWFSTDSGLSRYDGYSFQAYTTIDGLTSNTVFNFFKDPRGDIWCSTNNETLFIIRGDEPKFIPYKWNNLIQSSTNVSNTIKEVAFDEDKIYITFINSFGFLSVSDNGTIRNNLSKKTIKHSSHITVASKKGKSFVFNNFRKTSFDLDNFNKSYFIHNGYGWRMVSTHLQNENTVITNVNKDLLFFGNGNKRTVKFNYEVLNHGKLDLQKVVSKSGFFN